MKRTFDDLPGWTFHIDEVSAGVYEVVGRDARGRQVSSKGTDFDALLAECKSAAARLSGVAEPKA
jgi:hypothetical protein